MTVQNHISAAKHGPSFQVEDFDNHVKCEGKTTKNKVRYLITVRLANNQQATYRCESKSLTAAFEMIETISQQTKGLTPDQYQEHKRSRINKPVRFNFSTDRDGHDHATAFKAGPHSHSLKYAFNPNKVLKTDNVNPKYQQVLKIDSRVVQDLKDMAKLHKTRIHNQSAQQNQFRLDLTPLNTVTT